MSKTCFVIMPIGQAGTEKHAHFETVYEYIKSTVEARGYVVLRADEVAKSGAITKDIITRLAEADLVVADMTGLNPNVFYELGVRHALRGSGTVMILDTATTDTIPFDLSAYRVVKFKSDLAGIKTLTQGLEAYVEQTSRNETIERDNPVHDWFPTLPVNAVEASSKTEAGDLRKRIKDLERIVTQYEQAYGANLSESEAFDSPIAVISSTLQDAKDGLLPHTVMTQVRQYFEQKDVVAFLEAVNIAFDRGIRLGPPMFLELSRWAGILDLKAVQTAIFEQGMLLYPSEKPLRIAYLASLCQSDDAADRRQARAEIPKHLSFSIDGDVAESGQVEGPAKELDVMLAVMLLDAYQQDELSEEALNITTKLMQRYPADTRVLRNHARALENIGRRDEAFELYKKAVSSPSVDDTSAVWLGNEYSRRGDWARGAGAYVLACILDSNDAINFARLTMALATGFREATKGADDHAVRPPFLTGSTFEILFSCAYSCPNMGGDAQARLIDAFEEAELELPAEIQELNRAGRRAAAKELDREIREWIRAQETE